MDDPSPMRPLSGRQVGSEGPSPETLCIGDSRQQPWHHTLRTVDAQPVFLDCPMGTIKAYGEPAFQEAVDRPSLQP